MPTPSRPNTATGWATPSPPAAASATTTRRWASPRAAPGKASSAISASWAWTRRARTSRVVGVGDMSGDVFGNGMLLSRHIRLIAAFDHRHVFIDPTPDAATSFAERERLFKLPRSSWADYDASLISAGGGVWSRAEKSIPLSPQARAALGIEAERLPPVELLSAILKAPVDLLYNGGIGTYIKARSESHAEVGDRANDALRINGGELRCKVVAEGGNLGCTQLGRIEAALAGRAHQHRCHRQLGRRRHLRPRGQHQDPARPGGGRRRDDREAAQRAAAADDRRRGRAGAGRQLLPDAGAVADARAGRGAARPAGALHAAPGEDRPARPRHRVPAQRRADRRAQGRRAWA